MLVVLAAVLLVGAVSSHSSLRFPEAVSTGNYVKLSPDFSKIASKEELTMCTWIKKYLDPRVQHIWFSYAVSGGSNELMMSDWWHNILGDHDIMLWNDVILLQKEWYHFCLSWSSATQMEFYVNGVLVKTQASDRLVRAGGVLILGQDQDSLGGGFDLNQSFGGEIHGMNVFARKLRLEEMVGMFYEGRCGEVPSSLVYDVVLDWEQVLAAPRHGAVQVVPADCPHSSEFFNQVSELVLDELKRCRL